MTRNLAPLAQLPGSAGNWGSARLQGMRSHGKSALRALKEVNRKIFFILLGVGLVGVLALLPFMADLIAALPVEKGRPDVPLPLLIALTLLQNAILLSVAIIGGLILSERVGFRMPLIQAIATRAPLPDWKAIALPGLLTGAAAGAVMVALEAALFLRHIPDAMVALFDVPLWKRLGAGLLYGGINEELLMRLFLLSLLTWILGRWWRTPEGRPTSGAIRTSIVVVAILFGLGHLPATAALAPLTPALVTRALVLNGLAGIAFGVLYWKRGLEAAMLGHMGAHLVLQIPGVMLIRSLL